MNKTDKKLLIFCVVNLLLVVVLGFLLHMSELARIEYNERDVKSAREMNEKIQMLQNEIDEIRAEIDRN